MPPVLTLETIIMAKSKSNPKNTSPAIAQVAGTTLADSGASGIQRQFAGSVLSQVNHGRQPSPAIQRRAGQALQSDRSADLTKQLAASLLSQSPSGD